MVYPYIIIFKGRGRVKKNLRKNLREKKFERELMCFHVYIIV